ncbi:MAG: prolipoprotein diacylglyceryl transferase [Planctomycetes bacterium]|nr:prolipoprotein diacylglyceryl transferase [Planctomycetota bacterium]
MQPRIIDLGSFTINGYGLMIGLAIPLCYWLVSREARRSGLKTLDENLIFLFFWLAGVCYLGAKLAFMIAYPDDLRTLYDAGGFGAVLREGFVFYGSLVLGIPVTWYAMRRYRVPFGRGIDTVSYVLPLGHAFGRLGCFLAGCCHGCRTDVGWAVTFPPETMGLPGAPLHPVQLYEAAGNLLIFVFLWWSVRPRYRFPGQVLLTYLLLYAVLRLVTETFRGDGNPVYVGGATHHQAGAPPTGLTQAQIISIIAIVVGAPLLWNRLRATAHRLG